MAVYVYPLALENLGQGNIDFANETVRYMFVDSTAGYTPAPYEEYVADLAAGVELAGSGHSRVILANPIWYRDGTDMVFDADDPADVTATGGTAAGVIFFIDKGADAANILLCYDDSASLLPFTFTGVAQPVDWNANGIFRLAGG